MKVSSLGHLKIKFDEDGKTLCELIDTVEDKEIPVKNDNDNEILREHKPLSIIINNMTDRNSKRRKARNIDRTLYKLQLLAFQIRMAELANLNKKVYKKG